MPIGGRCRLAAAGRHFARACHMASIAEVFREVESGAAHYGVVPVENSTEGVVNHTLDSFMGSPLKIAGEVELRIHHHLLVAPGIRRLCAGCPSVWVTESSRARHGPRLYSPGCYLLQT